MTYCVGIEVDEGLVFAADTRTNASLDDVRVHRKLHEFEFPGEAAFVIMPVNGRPPGPYVINVSVPIDIINA